MWAKPWKLSEGFAIGGGLIAVGVLLQLLSGPVDWDAFARPVNIITLWVFIGIIVLSHLLRNKVYVLRYLGSFAAAVPAMVYAVSMTIIMGLTLQTGEGRWFNNMLSFWPFVLTYVYIAYILGLVIMRRATGMRFTAASMKRDIPFMMNHLGLFLAMVTATLGNPDMKHLKMIAYENTVERRAIDDRMRVWNMPFSVELKRFIMETYDDGSPRRFASDLNIVTPEGENIRATVDVNHPIKVDGWKIYQFGYDVSMGAESDMSIIEFVYDPWLPAVYTGIYMMLAGALLMFIGLNKNRQ
ncbi:MAG: cytochrome c biogenesis protein ResB [Bacteroidaceae bacterium]|nr:cytochrome c biogenesis protein ResB [Bacteroidaceae bacterium]